MEYSRSEQIKIQSVFEELNDRNIRYVVPRGYRALPKSTTGGDIDMIVKEHDFNKAIEICEELGFDTRRNIVQNASDLLVTGLRKPQLALDLLLNSPRELWIHFQNVVTPGQNVFSVNSEFDDQRRYNGRIMFHFLNHVAYKSPLNDAMVRVDPEVEQSLYDRRRVVDGIAVPSPADELVHLLCRGVFDYDGDFPQRYIDRCERIRPEVINHEEDHLMHLLSLVFFEADTVVLKNVRNGTYNQIKSDLLKFSSY